MNKAQIPAKTFEYLRTGRPILAITQPDGATGMLLSHFRHTVVVDPLDTDGLLAALRRLHAARRDSSASPAQDVQRFDRRDLTRSLAALCNKVLRRIRVMHLVPSLETGGMENGVVNLVNHLDRARFSSLICCCERLGVLKQRVASDVTVINCSAASGIQFGLFRKLARIFKEHSVDIVHTHNFYTLVYGALAARLGGCRTVVHGEHGRHGKWPLRRRLLTRILTSGVKRVLCVSESIRSMLLQEGMHPSKIQVIPNGIDPDTFTHPRPTAAEMAPLGIAPDDIVIGSVGRLVAVKDFTTLISAFALLKREYPQALLMLVGDGPERTRLEAHAADAGCSNRVRFLGERDDATSLYRFMRVFCLPSLSEGMSNVILEAMAAKVPVVATRVGDNPLLIDEKTSGLLVEPGNPESLARAILKLIADPELARAMALAGYRRVTERFSIVTMAQSYAQVYKELFTIKAMRRSRQ
jgi:sugar transferase (PEP-CTERM/EpsH1 system associated)